MLPKPIPDKLPGTVLPQYVRCGNAGCHCARGELHGPYWYRFWHEDGYKLRKQYVRKADVERVRAACAAYKQENREGRELIMLSDDLLRWLAEEGRSRRIGRREIEMVSAMPRTLPGLLDYGSGRKGGRAIRLRAIRRLAHIRRAMRPERRDNASPLLGM